MNEQVVNVRLIALDQQRIPDKKNIAQFDLSTAIYFIGLGTMYQDILKNKKWFILYPKSAQIARLHYSFLPRNDMFVSFACSYGFDIILQTLLLIYNLWF